MKDWIRQTEGKGILHCLHRWRQNKRQRHREKLARKKKEKMLLVFRGEIKQGIVHCATGS